MDRVCDYDLFDLFNTLRPRQNGCQFPDDIFKCIFLNENVWILIKISLMFVPMGPINNIPALVQIMAWRRSGDKPLSEPMMVRLPTHICVNRPQWVNNKCFEIIPSSRTTFNRSQYITYFIFCHWDEAKFIDIVIGYVIKGLLLEPGIVLA